MPPDDADDARRLIEETARASAEAVARRLAETRPGPDQQRHTRKREHADELIDPTILPDGGHHAQR